MKSVAVVYLVVLCRLAVSSPVSVVQPSTVPVQTTTNTRLPQSTITSQQPTTSQLQQPRDFSTPQSGQQDTSTWTNEQTAAPLQGPMMRSPAVATNPEAQAREQNVALMEMFASMLKPRIMGADGAAAEAAQQNQQQQPAQQPIAQPVPQTFVQGQGFVPQQQFVQQPFGLNQPVAPQQFQQMNPWAAQQVPLQSRLLAMPANNGLVYPGAGLPVQQFNPYALYGRADVAPVVQQLPQQTFQQPQTVQQPQTLAAQQVPQQQFQQPAQMFPQQAANLNTPAAQTAFNNPQNFNTAAGTNQFPQTQFQG